MNVQCLYTYVEPHFMHIEEFTFDLSENVLLHSSFLCTTYKLSYVVLYGTLDFYFHVMHKNHSKLTERAICFKSIKIKSNYIYYISHIQTHDTYKYHMYFCKMKCLH